MRRPLVIYDFTTIPSEFPYIWENFDFLFYQCSTLGYSQTTISIIWPVATLRRCELHIWEEYWTNSVLSLSILTISLWTLPSNLLISSGGINFVTQTANFCCHLLGLFYQLSKNFKNTLPQIFFSFDVALCKKMLSLRFFKDFLFVRFCDEINFENSKQSPKKHQQGVNLQHSYSHEIFI